MDTMLFVCMSFIIFVSVTVTLAYINIIRYIVPILVTTSAFLFIGLLYPLLILSSGVNSKDAIDTTLINKYDVVFDENNTNNITTNNVTDDGNIILKVIPNDKSSDITFVYVPVDTTGIYTGSRPNAELEIYELTCKLNFPSPFITKVKQYKLYLPDNNKGV